MCYVFSQRSTYLRHNMQLIPIVLRKYAFVLLNFHHYVCFIFKTSNTVLPPIQMLTGMLCAGPTGRTSWVFLPLFTYPSKGVVWTLTSLPPSTSIHQGAKLHRYFYLSFTRIGLPLDISLAVTPLLDLSGCHLSQLMGICLMG